MKCAREGCGETISQMELDRGMKYHSRDCAPLAHLAGERGTKSARTESIFRAPGVALIRPFGLGKQTRKTMRRGRPPKGLEKKNVLKKGDITMQIRPNFQPSSNENTTPTQPIEKNNSEVEQSEPNALTHVARSVEASQILGRDESDSMSLIESSVRSLQGLMKSAEEQIRQMGKPGHLTPSLINSAANCADKIQKLLKLKLEIAQRSGK